MQVIDLNVTQEQFEASQGIETLDDLCRVLGYLANNVELSHQLVDTQSELLPTVVFNKQFNHVFLNTERAFGKHYSKEEIDALMDRMRRYIAPHDRVRGFDDFDLNFSAIKQLGGMGVDVSVSFQGHVETEKEDETRTYLCVTFNVVQYALPFKIAC